MEHSAAHPSRPFYGWVVAGVAASTNGLAWSVRSTFSLFYAAMLLDLGWSRAETALGYGLSWLCMIVFSPLVGHLFDRFGSRVVVPVGGAALGLGLALSGIITQPWQYYVLYGVVIAFGISATMGPTGPQLARWFVRRRGLAMAIAAAGSSAGTLLFMPVVQAWIDGMGWRTGLLVYGAVVAGIIIPVAALLQRDRPAAMGTWPDGVPPAAGSQPAAGRPADLDGPEWTVRRAMANVRFWAVFTLLMMGVVSYQILMVHQVAHARDMGFETGYLAAVFGVSGIATLAGNLIGGPASDRWGREWVFTAGSVVGLAGIAGLAFLNGPGDEWKLWLYVLGVGVGFGARISLLNVIPADIFQGKNYGLIQGLLSAGSGLGGFLGAYGGGFLFDVTQSYGLAFGVSAAAVVISGAAVWIARPAHGRGSPAPDKAAQKDTLWAAKSR